MRIAFVSTGQLPIPAPGYGGIELVLHYYRQILERLGHEVRIVNVMGGASIARRLRIVREVNSFRPDLAHIHASKYFNLSRWLRCRGIFLTDHAPEVSLATYPHHRRALRKNTRIICLSENIRRHYLAAGAPPGCAHVIPNGLMTERFRFAEAPRHREHSLCLAVINRRKRQHLLCGIPGLYFAGPVEEEIALGENYLGEWSREQVENDLTDYANLVLLSESEVAAALVCLEAMASGLGLVISQTNAANLDTSLPFIDVIAEDKITDREHVAAVIAKNRATALGMRRQIRGYAKKNFDVAQIVEKQYLPLARATMAARPLVDS